MKISAAAMAAVMTITLTPLAVRASAGYEQTEREIAEASSGRAVAVQETGISAPENEREIETLQTAVSGDIKEAGISTPGAVKETDTPAADTSESVKETGSPAADTSGHMKGTDTPAADTSESVKETGSPPADTSGTVKEDEAPSETATVGSVEKLSENMSAAAKVHVISGTAVTAPVSRARKGDHIDNNGDTYVITRATTYRGDGTVKNAGEAALLKSGTNAVKIKVPASIKAAGVSCKVTLIKKKAFSGSKKAKQIIIGKNVTEIRKNAFKGLKKLTLIKISSKKLAAVRGSRTMALGKIKINVPNDHIAVYKSLIIKAGGKKAVVV